MNRAMSKRKSIYHIVEKDESEEEEEEIECVSSSDKVTALDDKFFEKFSALKFADGEAGQDSYQPIQDNSTNNNAADVDFTLCRGLYKDIPHPTQKEVQFFYQATLTAIHQRLGVRTEMRKHPNSELFTYAKEVLKVKAEEHSSLLDRVSQHTPPPLVLVVDVLSAKDLISKDANGLSDPFCMLGIVAVWNEPESSSKKAKNCSPKLKRHDLLMDHLSQDSIMFTRVEEKTLNPKWNQQFRFDVGDVSNEQLQLEVWDHDEDASVLDTMKNIGDVANLKGMGRFFKELAQSAKSSGKNLDDFLGWISVPLNTISSQGMECYFPLQARSAKSKVEGEIRLKLQLALKKEDPRATRQAMAAVHQYLWYNFVHHEVCDKSMTAYRWNGQLEPVPNAIVHQLAQQHELPELYQLASQWIAYSQPCVLPHMDVNVMLSIIKSIAHLWEQKAPDSQMARYLQTSCQEFVEHSLQLLQKQHEAFSYRDTEAILQLHLLLKCLVVIKRLSEDLHWRLFQKPVEETIVEAVKQSARDWFIKQHQLCEAVYETGRNELTGDDEEIEETPESRRVSILVSLIENMIHHVKVQLKPPSLVYKKAMDVNLAKLVHAEFAMKIMEEIKPVLNNAKRLSASETHHTVMSLFSLYLAVKGFHAAADREYRTTLETKDFHLAFKKSVEQWFDLARQKSKARIQKAVEVDEVRLVDSMVKHSSSAVDVTTTFAQIKEFWNKLDWPDASGAYVFVAKVTDDIRQGAVEYANIIHAKLEQNSYYDDEGRFDVTDQLCIAVNNIEQVRRSLGNLPDQLDYEHVLDGVLMEYGSVGAEQCNEALHTMLSSADEDMLNVIGRVVKHVGLKMKPDLKKYTAGLMSAPASTSLDEVINTLMEYLDSNLITLHNCLLKANFHRILEELWLIVLNILKEMVNSGFKTLNQEPAIGQRMHDAFEIIGVFFHAEGKGLPMSVIECASYQEVVARLSKFGMTTKRLMADYLNARTLQQEQEDKLAEAPLGLLTVKCNYKQSQQKLRVRVMNASNISPMDKDGLSDPYVIVSLQPQHVFPDVHFKKTQVMKKTLHPLFDETFEFIIPHSQILVYGATIHFVLMDYDFLTNDFGGEAFISLSSIPGVHGQLDGTLAQQASVSLHLMPVIQEGNEAWPIVQTLKERSSDKEASEFLKLNRLK